MLECCLITQEDGKSPYIIKVRLWFLPKPNNICIQNFFLTFHPFKKECLDFSLFLAMPCSMWGLISLTRDWDLTPCIGRRVCQGPPLDCQRSPWQLTLNCHGTYATNGSIPETKILCVLGPEKLISEFLSGFNIQHSLYSPTLVNCLRESPPSNSRNMYPYDFLLDKNNNILLA